MTEIRTVGVCGAGTMGAGIAIVAARAGYRTVLYDTQAPSLERARGQTEAFFAKSVERGKMTEEQVTAALADYTSTTELAGLAGCDVVIEAVFEDLEVKRGLFKALEDRKSVV